MPKIAALMRPALFSAVLVLAAAAPASAQEIAYEAVAGYTISSEPGEDLAIAPEQVADPDIVTETEVVTGGSRLVFAQPAPVPRGIAAYGPFRVIDETHAALVGVTDSATPAAFAAMLGAHPGIGTIEMIACPGTEDDRANLRLGLMIRGKGLDTHVPDGGFVGSGAVELFLAGLHRSAESSAAFAVHSWEDESGRQAKDYSLDDPMNRAYLDYYQAVGMTAPEARAFYAMTNSVPFTSAKWLTQADMAHWVKLDGAAPTSAFGPVPALVLTSAVQLDAAMPVLDLGLTLQ